MGGPYAATDALVGGIPTIPVDVPICAIFLAIFLGGAICHIGLFRYNMMRKHKFIPSAVTFGFCMSRIAANSVRIAWACHPDNRHLGIAAQIFVAAGVVLLFILNLLYSHRMLRAAHPRIGWSLPVSWAFKGLYIAIVLSVVMVITVTVQSAYTMNNNTHRIDRDVQLYVVTAFAIIAFLPLLIVPAVVIFPWKNERIEKFGKGSWRAKAAILCFVAGLLCLGASFRAGTVWEPPRLASNPAWYHHKACFYLFNFTIEAIVVYLYLIVRMDLRFHVPNGSSKVRHYRGGFEDLALGMETEMEAKTDQTQDGNTSERGSGDIEIEHNSDVENIAADVSATLHFETEKPGQTIKSVPKSPNLGHETDQE